MADDLLELGIAVGMVPPLLGLAVGLEAVARLGQEPTDGLMIDGVPPFGQGLSQVPGAVASPQHGGHGIAAGGRIDQAPEVAKRGGSASASE